MVGKILDKRYVVLEEVGADGAGFRYLVYDMNTLRRLHLRVDPDGSGQLSGNTYAVVDMGAPLAPAKQPAAAAPPAARERKTSPAATPRPRQPTPRGFAPTSKLAEAPEDKPTKEVNVARAVPKDGDKDSVPIPRLDALPSKTEPPQEPALLRKPKATPVPPGLEEKPLEQALERALTDAQPAAAPEETKDPFNTTQPIDLASAEEIAQEAQQAQQPEPVSKQDQRQSGERPRIQTKVLEAAWFAQGDQLEEEEEQPEEIAQRQVDHDQLERQAAELSPDEYRKYALDLPPPMPPPVRIVEAFLGAKPDVVARLVDQEKDRDVPSQAPGPTRVAQPIAPAPAEPATAEPPPPSASPFQIAPPAEAPRPKVPTPRPKVATPRPRAVTPPPKVEVVPPKMEVVPPPKVEVAPPPKVELAPPPKVEVAPPPKVELVPPPKVEVAPPPKVELAPPPKVEVAAELVPPPVFPPPAESAPALVPELYPPIEQVLPPEPALPEPAPPVPVPAPEVEPFKPPEPLPPTQATPTFPPRATALRGTSARLPADQLWRKPLESRAGTFLLGLLLGGLVAGGLTCLLTPDTQTPPAASKVVSAAAPEPVVCPKPPPCKTTSPRRVAAPTPAPAPASVPKDPELSAKDKRQLNKYLRLANRAMKRHQWKRARNLASLALKLDPKEPRAQRIKHRAERRLGR